MAKNALKYMKDHNLNLSFMSLPLSVRLASFAASCKLYTVVPLHMDTSLMWTVSHVPTIFSYITSKKPPYYYMDPLENGQWTLNVGSGQQIHTNLTETISPREFVYMHIFN